LLSGCLQRSILAPIGKARLQSREIRGPTRRQEPRPSLPTPIANTLTKGQLPKPSDAGISLAPPGIGQQKARMKKLRIGIIDLVSRGPTRAWFARHCGCHVDPMAQVLK